MKEIVFEDSLYPKVKTEKGGVIISDLTRYIVISGMLYKSISLDNNINIVFTESIGNIRKFIDEYIDNKCNESTLLYIDFPIDNERVVEGVLDIVNVIVQKKLMKIIPILIPCIEYYAIIEFGNRESTDYNIVRDLEKYRDTDTCKSNVSKSFQSFEKYCKAVFSKIVPQKYHGSIAVSEFESIIGNDECLRLIHSLPVYKDEFSTNGCDTSYEYTVSMEQFEKLLQQSKKYNDYDINDELLEEMAEIMCALNDMWQE